MTYFHVPAPMLAELRYLLKELEEMPNNAASAQLKGRAVTARIALSGVNAYMPQDEQDCHHAS